MTHADDASLIVKRALAMLTRSQKGMPEFGNVHVENGRAVTAWLSWPRPCREVTVGCDHEDTARLVRLMLDQAIEKMIAEFRAGGKT